MFNRICIAGVGLIGGSFALALKRAGKVRHVVGMGRSRASLDEALALGIIDEACEDWALALKDCDLLLLAMPVGQMDLVMAAAAPHLGANTLITDAGSTKRDVVQAIYRHLGAHLPNVVPAHPIAGAEKSGALAASAELYQSKKVVITALPESSPEAISAVSQAWAACGAQIFNMSPPEHDRVFAAVSHLPHLLAFGLVHELALREDSDVFFNYAASGFRDFTRIAGSHPEMWRDICVSNRHALLQELDAYRAELDKIRAMLESADAPALEQLFAEARKARNEWAARQIAPK